MKNLNVTLKCHGGQVTWWDGAGQGGAKQGVVYKPTHVCPTDSVLLVLLSTEWVDYMEKPMKYQAVKPHFFSVVGWGGGLGVMEWVLGGGGGVAGGVEVVVVWSAWCAGEGCGWWREYGWWHG